MTWRDDDDRKLLLEFLAWLTPINVPDAKQSAEEDKRIADRFLVERRSKDAN